MSAYLTRYAVAAVIVAGPPTVWDARRDLLEPAEGFGPYRVYKTRTVPSYFAEGEGRVAAQELDSVHVVEARGNEIVLRFHFLETLRCRPGCTVERVDVPHDRAGFVRVPRPPVAFEIYAPGD